ncbi:MAG: hypothetical protein HC933_22995 [Pleurocapsa sp. SU_196_0]|nr:hypothetical protein [Pleurocapsa sp. SU_196_0]
MLTPALARRALARRKDRTVWRECVTLETQTGDALEIEARIYPDAGVVVLKEIGDRGGSSVVGRIEEIALELTARYPETMDTARITLFQPANMWTTRPRYLEWLRALEPSTDGFRCGGRSW